MKLISLTTTDPTVNLALEELLSQDATEPIVMLWRNGPSIIVGKNQNTAAEIDGDAVSASGIPVVRRITGGGTVYHDLGNINYSCISLEREWGEESGTAFTRPIVEALKALGIQAEYSGRNDILANGLKVSGCARSVPRAHTLFHGTLLFDTDLDVLARVLRPDPEKIRSKGIKSVRARVGNLKTMLPSHYQTMDMNGFIAHLTRFISHYYGDIPFISPSQDWQERAVRLADEKYRTWEWNYGTPLTYEVSHRIRCAGGTVQADYNVQDNRIASLHFSGDFFGAFPIEALSDALNGQFPRQDAIAEVLARLHIGDYIAGITPEELTALLCI